jgi:hypothetical protein
MSFDGFCDKMISGAKINDTRQNVFDKINSIDRSQTRNLKRAEYKNTGGYILSCTMTETIRRKEFCDKINLLVIDFDDELDIDVLSMSSKIEKWSHIFCSSFSWTEEKPRYHLYVECDGGIPSDYYEVGVLTVAKELGIEKVTPESLNPVQPWFVTKYYTDFKPICVKNVNRAFNFDDLDLSIGVQPKTKNKSLFESQDLLYAKQPMKISDDEVKDQLRHIDPSMPYTEWLTVCFALKHQYQFDDEKGFEIFNEWSAEGGNYGGYEDCRAVWSRAKANCTDRAPVTWKSLAKRTNADYYGNEIVLPENCGINPFSSVYYVVEAKEYYDLRVDYRFDTQQFDSTYRVYQSRYNFKGSPSGFVDASGQKVLGYKFRPGEGKFLKEEGKSYINIWLPFPEVKLEDPVLYPKHKMIIDEHFKRLYSNVDTRKTIYDFLGYTVQYPEVKIKWVLLLQSFPGAGKTTIRTMLARAVGKQNIVDVYAYQVRERYNSWFEGKKVVVFEDLNLKGQGSGAVMQKLKGYITNETIPVEAKYRNTYDIDNIASLIALTEYKHAVPLEPNDRRWFIAFSDIQTLEQKLDLVQGNYFGEINNIIRNYPGHLIKFFNDIEISPDFNLAIHPHCPDKEETIRQSTGDLEDYIDELIREEHPLCNQWFVAIGALQGLCQLGNVDHRHCTLKAIKNMISTKGYSFCCRVEMESSGWQNIYHSYKDLDLNDTELTIKELFIRHYTELGGKERII